MLITYNFNNINIQDEYQLDLFLDTYTPHEKFYNSLYYKGTTLKIYTNEESYSGDTLAVFDDLFSKYPNPPPTITRNLHRRKIPGAISTFDNIEKDTVLVPVGFPGQTLVADPNLRTGFAWEFPSTDASNGTRNDITDLYTRYLDIYDSVGSQIISGTPISINYNKHRRVDPAYNHDLNTASVITLVDPGTYTFSLKVGVQWFDVNDIPDFDAILQAYIEVTSPGNNIPTKLISTDIYITLPSNVTSIFKQSKFGQFSYQSATGGELVSCKIKEISNSNNVITSPNLNELSSIKFTIDDPINDQGEYLNIYDSVGDLVIGTDWTDIPLTANSLMGSYTHFEPQNDGTLLYIFTPGNSNFFLVFKSALKVVGAALGNSIICHVKMMFDAGGGWTDLDGTHIFPISFNITSTNWDNMKTYSVNTVLTFPADTLLKFCAKVESNNGTGVVKTIQNCNVCNVIYPFGGVTGQDTIRAFVGLNTEPINLTQYYWTDISLEYTVILDNLFLQTPDKKSVIISDTGTYQIVYRIAITDASSSNPGMITARIVVNAGNGFFEVSGSRITTCYQGDNRSVGLGTSMLYLGHNYQMKLQVLIENSGPNVSNTATCIPYDCNLMIFKFEQTVEPLPLPGMNIFGNFYTEVSNTHEDMTYQTNFVEKLRLITPTITNGNYRIIWRFNWSMSSTIDPFIASIKHDDVEIVNFNNTTMIPYHDNNYMDLQLIDLEGGSHTFTISWKSSNSDVAAIISNAKMEFLKIT